MVTGRTRLGAISKPNRRAEMKKQLHVLAAVVALVAGGSALAQDATPRVDQRQANQQTRIEQGVASGQLTRRETNKLERREGKIAGDEARAKADGVVTGAERAKLKREQNNASAAIYKQKH